MNLEGGADDRLRDRVEIFLHDSSCLQELSQRDMEDFALCESLRALR